MSSRCPVVLTADQIGSRVRGDRVPAALAALADLATDGDGRPFARTAGDEIQGLLVSSDDAVRAVERLMRLGGWRVGIGVGPVDEPLPDDVRAGSGHAFVAARAGVEAARTSASTIAVRGAHEQACARLEAAFGLLSLAWRRRTVPGWEVAQMLDAGVANRDVAARLGVTPSAVSQRASAAAVEEATRGKLLAAWLLDDARRMGDA